MSESKPDNFKPSTRLRDVFAAAFAGLLHTLGVQRNMKIHWVSGFMVMVVGMAIDFDLSARAALFFSVFLILFAEILNSALEAFVDLHIQQYHYQAKLAKDAAAAGVLVLAAAVLILFADLLVMNRQLIARAGDDVWRAVVLGLPIVAMLGAQLFGVWPLAFRIGLLMASLGALGPLVLNSHDPFFSLSAALFLLLAFEARRRHPRGER